MHEFATHEKEVDDLHFSPDSAWVASISKDRSPVDPSHFGTDPDSDPVPDPDLALFVSGVRCQQKIIFFGFLLFEITLTSMSQRSHKTVKTV